VNGQIHYLDLFQLYRFSNRSNVFLIETDDPKRLAEFLGFIKTKFSDYKNIYHINIQLRELTVIKGQHIQPQEIRKVARIDPTIAVYSWVITKEHARSLLDLLVALSHDEEMYFPRSARLGSMVKLPSTIVVFTHSLSFFPENVRKLFAEISIPPSNEKERKVIIDETIKLAKMKGLKVSLRKEAYIASAGLNLHEIETALLESIKTRQVVDAETFRVFKVNMLKRYGLEYIEPKYGFEAVGGYGYLKDFLKKRIILFYRYPNLIKKYGLRPPRGILLFGPPGTGKSWLAKALAREMRLPMVSLNAADLLRGIVGESEQRARKITRLLESMAPIVVFIDEADQLFQSRGQVMSTDSGVFRRVQNILLEWLGDEERKSFIVMATNYLEQFDFASVRAGRIDYAIPVMFPDYEARKEIVKLHTEVLTKPMVKIEVDYKIVAEKTIGFTGAELRQLCETAKILAATSNSDKITTEHFMEAMGSFNIDIEERKQLVEQYERQAKAIKTVIIPRDILEISMSVLNEKPKSQDVFSRVSF